MKTVTYQTDKKHSSAIQKYGCLFKSIAYFSKKDVSVEEQNIIWDILVRNGYITGDLNGDGDVDDALESMILNHDAVADALGSDIEYLDAHFPPDTPIPSNCVAIGCFKWKHTHFAVLDRKKNVIYDPTPNSNTVKYGKLISLRLYKIKKGNKK
jgi:hypothetical protein